MICSFKNIAKRHLNWMTQFVWMLFGEAVKQLVSHGGALTVRFWEGGRGRGRGDLFNSSQTLKNPQISKIQASGARSSDFGWFQMSFGVHFSPIAWSSENLVICNTYNAKCLFLLLKASHSGIKIHPQIIYSKPLSWRPFFGVDAYFIRKSVDPPVECVDYSSVPPFFRCS